MYFFEEIIDVQKFVCIPEDSEQNLWIGTLGNGLDRFVRETNTFVHYKNDSAGTVRSGYISAITEDRAGNLWLGGATGIEILDKQSGTFSSFMHQQGVPKSLSSNLIFALHQDTQGRMWFATKDGLKF